MRNSDVQVTIFPLRRQQNRELNKHFDTFEKRTQHKITVLVTFRDIDKSRLCKLRLPNFADVVSYRQYLYVIVVLWRVAVDKHVTSISKSLQNHAFAIKCLKVSTSTDFRL